MNNNNNNQTVVPNAKNGLNRLKMETATELGVNLKEGYNGDMSAKDAGTVGGYMVKKMIRSAQENLK